jgi:hypothetical protein
MSPTTQRYSVTIALAATLVLAASIARADDLPPTEAPGYSAVYKMTSRSRVEPTDDWTFHNEDTVTIAVLNKQSRWEFKRDGHTIINDNVALTTTEFGGSLPPKTAVRTQSTFATIGWEFGTMRVSQATPAKPEILGTTTIAGRECTRIRFTSTQFGKPEFCVTKTGVPLRFANASSTAETVYEAQSVDEKAPPADRFAVPAGYTLEQRAAEPRRNLNLKF